MGHKGVTKPERNGAYQANQRISPHNQKISRSKSEKVMPDTEGYPLASKEEQPGSPDRADNKKHSPQVSALNYAPP